MAKEELIEMQGVVNEVLPDSRFRVTLDNGHQLIAYSAGKMKKNHIRILDAPKKDPLPIEAGLFLVRQGWNLRAARKGQSG